MVADPSLHSKYWLVRKVVAVVGYYGGFRNIELKALKFGFVLDGDNNPSAEKVIEKSVDGSYWIKFFRSKQRKSQVLTTICIPKCSEEMVACNVSVDRMSLGVCPASVIDQYLNVLSSDLKCPVDELEGDFFKGTYGVEGKKFGRSAIGKNKLALVGIEFARELMLPNPTCYTGHCWRRSCSTNSSDAGVNVTSLMAHMGWSDPKTAIRYVAKSKQSAHQMALYLCNAQRSNMREADLFQIPEVAPVLNAGSLSKRLKIVEESVSKSSVLSSDLVCHSQSSEESICQSSVLSSDLVCHSQSSVLSVVRESSEAFSVGVSPSSASGCESSSKALSGSVSSCSASSVPSIGNCSENSKPENSKPGVGSKVEVEPGFLGAVGPVGTVGECLTVVPVVKVENESLERSVGSRLSGLVGAINSSGTINFHIHL